MYSKVYSVWKCVTKWLKSPKVKLHPSWCDRSTNCLLCASFFILFLFILFFIFFLTHVNFPQDSVFMLNKVIFPLHVLLRRELHYSLSSNMLAEFNFLCQIKKQCGTKTDIKAKHVKLSNKARHCRSFGSKTLLLSALL